MDMPMALNQMQLAETKAYRRPAPLRIVVAQPADGNALVALCGALHTYNASLDASFSLAEGWRALLGQAFNETYWHKDKLWLLVKDGEQAVGLLIAGIHCDSPLYRHRRWVEVEALYVAPSHRRRGLAQGLLNEAYAWAAANGLARVQLYVTASNVRAQSVYRAQGFAVTQAIMRKTL